MNNVFVKNGLVVFVNCWTVIFFFCYIVGTKLCIESFDMNNFRLRPVYSIVGLNVWNSLFDRLLKNHINYMVSFCPIIKGSASFLQNTWKTSACLLTQQFLLVTLHFHSGI